MVTLNTHRYLNSTYLLYFCFFIMLFMMLFIKDVHLESPEVGAVTQILHPEYPKGSLQYDPSYHYDYIIAFLAEKLGYRDNFNRLAPLFWFVEMALAILVLIKLCNYIFKNDKLVLVITIMMFIFLKSGEIDQKTMLMPLYFAAVYYFLREKWYISAFFGAAIFYLHVGFAIWWFLPSCFALCIIFLKQRRLSLTQIFRYIAVVLILSSPIIYFYLGGRHSIKADAFSIKYYYFTCWNTTSVLLSLLNFKSMISTMLTVAILLVGYRKASKVGCKTDYILAILIGVLIMYLIVFIGADIIGNGTVITLQLLRSIVNIELFSSLFFAFLLAKQIKSGNYIFFAMFVIVSRFYYSGISRFIGNIPFYDALNILYFIILVYEIFEEYINRYILGIYNAFTFHGKINMSYFKKIVGKSKELLQHPILIAILLILLAAPKSMIKSFFNIPQHNNAAEWNRDRYLFDDMAKFTNEKITDKDALLLTPFLNTDFEFYTVHNTFINYATPIFAITPLHSKSKFEFRSILEDNLNFSFEEVFNIKNFNLEKFRSSWGHLWRNLNEDTIRQWHRKYNLTHVIREKEMPLDFPILYQNKFYIIYEIK